ncbi:hypothetical protein CLF_100338 [Clonorchis sinensis]|uniref:Uncharacterized protein n=1 Tax=Clonorchis sinensis TaxID=79923 RepID=G7Y384_CLOSI|nr:hypothetical protein CLF_100338 [Clonorchis sinensis]
MLPPIKYKVKSDVEPTDDRIGQKYAELLSYLKSPFYNGNNGNHRGVSETGAVSDNPIKWKQDRSLRTSLTLSEKHPNPSSKTSPKLRSKSIGTRNVAAHGETRCGNPKKEKQLLGNQPGKTDSKSESEKYLNVMRWPAFQRFTDERILRWLQEKDEKLKEQNRRKKREQKSKRILAKEIKVQQQHRVQMAGAAYEAWLSNKSSKPKDQHVRLQVILSSFRIGIRRAKVFVIHNDDCNFRSNPGDLSQPKSASDCTLNVKNSSGSSSPLPLDTSSISDTPQDSASANSVPLKFEVPREHSPKMEETLRSCKVAETLGEPLYFTGAALVADERVLAVTSAEAKQATPVACEDPPRCETTTAEFTVSNVTSLRLTHKQWVKRKFIQARNAEQARWQAEERVSREKECNSAFLNYWRDVLRMHCHRPELNSGTADRKALGEILKQLNCCTLVVGAQLPKMQQKQSKKQTRRLTLRFPATLLMPESCTEEDIQEANRKLSIDHTVIVVERPKISVTSDWKKQPFGLALSALFVTILLSSSALLVKEIHHFNRVENSFAFKTPVEHNKLSHNRKSRFKILIMADFRRPSPNWLWQKRGDSVFGVVCRHFRQLKGTCEEHHKPEAHLGPVESTVKTEIRLKLKRETTLVENLGLHLPNGLQKGRKRLWAIEEFSTTVKVVLC